MMNKITENQALERTRKLRIHIKIPPGFNDDEGLPAQGGKKSRRSSQINLSPSGCGTSMAYFTSDNAVNNNSIQESALADSQSDLENVPPDTLRKMIIKYRKEKSELKQQICSNQTAASKLAAQVATAKKEKETLQKQLHKRKKLRAVRSGYGSSSPLPTPNYVCVRGSKGKKRAPLHQYRNHDDSPQMRRKMSRRSL